MAGEFDQITAALKVAYPPKAIEPMVNEETPFRKELKRSVPAGARVSEAILKFGANLNPPQNVGQLADGGTLPPVKDRTQDQFQMTPVVFAGSFGIGGVTLAAGNSNKSAFNGGELARKTEETIADLAKFIESTYTGTHGTNRRARVESSADTTHFVAALPEGVELLRENYYITIRTTDGGATVDNGWDLLKISDIARSTRTVTVSSAASGAATADSHVHVVNETSQTITASNGLRGLIDDGTFLTTLHGLSRTTYPKLKSVVNGNGGTLRDLSEQILVRTCNDIRARSGKMPQAAWTSPGQCEKYLEFVAPDRRYVVTSKSQTQSMVTGYGEGDLVHVFPGGKLTIKSSFDIVPRELFLINWDTFFLYVAREMDWLDEGSRLKLIPASSAYKFGYLAYVASVENIGCDMPLGNGVIRDLKDPVAGDA